MASPAKRVAVTGSSGYVGSRLLRELEEERLGRLLALDTKPLALPIHGIVARRQDVQQPIHDLLRQNGVTTVVHLAASPNYGQPRRESLLTTDSNLRTLRAVLDSCSRAGVQHIVFLSAHAVYGVHQNNPVPLTEDAPLRANADHPAAHEKYLSERVLQEFEMEHPYIGLTVLRTPPVLGPGAPPNLSQIFYCPRPVKVGAGDAPFQFLHEDDLARAITAVIKNETHGVFNLAGEGVAFFSEIADALPEKVPRWPRFPACEMVRLSWNLGLQRSRSVSQFDFLQYPLVLSAGKLKHALDYRTRYTSLETLDSFVNSALT